MLFGEILELGGCRLMCGDATNPDHVAALFAGRKAAQVMTSPPYLTQRIGHCAGDWTAMMTDAFSELPPLDDAQLFVNLGLIHRAYDLIEYWTPWCDWMRTQGWRRTLYCWDQGFGLPGRWFGRFAPSFELVHHLQRAVRDPVKIMPKLPGNIGRTRNSSMLRFPNGTHKPKQIAERGLSDGTHKISDSVIRICRCNSCCEHPAMFPIALPAHFIRSYTAPGEIIYDPFAGSASTLLAAAQTGRIGLGMERDPAYCELAVARFNRAAAA